MKKLALVLTLALVLAFAAPVFANPFSDVPADHWAYDAISKLATDGVITGNPDGTYTGKKNLTRYEIAVIVAKAMAAAEANADKIAAEDQATINKLAAEFGSELAALGVKVAALEKKIGNVKFTGDARIRYRDQEVKSGDVKDGVNSVGFADMRIRLTATAAVNDKVNVVTRFSTDDYQLNQSNTGSPNPIVDNFYVEYKDKGVTAIAGRQDLALGQGTIFDDTIKGAVVAVPVGKLTATVAHGYLDTAEVNSQSVVLGNPILDKYTLTALQLDGIKLGDKVTLGFDYGIVKDKKSPLYANEDEVKIWGVNFGYALNDRVALFGEYTKSDMELVGKDNQAAMMIGFSVKKLVADTNLKVSYTKLGINSVVPGLYTNDGVYDRALANSTIDQEKTKLWNVKLDRPIMKNVTLYVDYYNAKTDGTSEGKCTRVDTGLEFKF